MPRRRRKGREILVAWGIGLALMLGIVVAAYVIRGGGNPTPATAFGQDLANFGAIELPFGPAAVIDGWPQRAGDGSHLYRLIAETYSANTLTRREYDDFLRDSGRAPARPGELPLLVQLVEAGRHSSATLLAEEPAALINYGRSLPQLDGLYAVAQCALKQAGLVAARGHPGDAAEARRLYEAALVLGLRLCEERIVHRELEYGYRLASQAMGGLTALAKQQQEAERAGKLSDQRQQFVDFVNTRIEPVWEKLSAINLVERAGDKADMHFGDVLAIAQSENADAMWRVEAILRLGKSRHDASRASDREAAEGALRKFASGASDARISLAAEQALKLAQAQRMNAR